MRILNDSASGRTVAVSANDVREFNRYWPCSNLPAVAMQFDFAGNGDLVDIRFASGLDSADYDGIALLTLSRDAGAYQPKSETE